MQTIKLYPKGDDLSVFVSLPIKKDEGKIFITRTQNIDVVFFRNTPATQQRLSEDGKSLLVTKDHYNRRLIGSWYYNEKKGKHHFTIENYQPYKAPTNPEIKQAFEFYDGAFKSIRDDALNKGVLSPLDA